MCDGLTDHPIIADLVMEDIEEIAITTARHPPKWWFRYVDDSHACLKKGHVNEFHQHLNSINPNIQFTVELEDTPAEQGLPFLDTITTRSGTRIEVNVYRKSTHTDRYLDFNSHLPMCHKRSVVSTQSATKGKEHFFNTGRETKRNKTSEIGVAREQLSVILYKQVREITVKTTTGSRFTI